MPRSGSTNGLGSRNSSSTNLSSMHGSTPIATRFAQWQPSERIQAMTPEQIADARERLNVAVDDDPTTADAAEGSGDASTSNNVAPIESFDDMVRGLVGKPPHIVV